VSLLVAWIIFPALLVALAIGAGLLVERAAGLRLPGALLFPLGLALLVVATQIATWHEATAFLATAAVVVLAAVGFAVGASRVRELAPDWSAVAAGTGTFLVFGLPVVLSGTATFAGYGQLGDTSIHFALIDRLMEHGRSLSGLSDSTYRAALQSYIDTGYPTGAQTTLGAVRPLVGMDLAWVWQPYMSLLMAAAVVSLYQLLAEVIEVRPARAVIAFLAIQPALVYGFALQGSVKELATVWILVLLCALVPITVAAAARVRSAAPILVASAAALGVISLTVLPWLSPILLALLLGMLIRKENRPQLRRLLLDAVVFGLALLVLAAPSLAVARSFVDTAQGVLTSSTEFGNLLRPLDWWQALGVWPNGDYRLPLRENLQLGYTLIGLVAFGVVIGLPWLVRRRAVGLLLFVGVSLIGWWYVTRRGSPWADAKALMILSPAVLVAAAAGVVSLWSATRLAAGLLGGAIAFGILWTNALAYHDADLAPRGRLVELGELGDRMGGPGPTLVPEFEEFAKHFLRDSSPVVPAEGRGQAPRGPAPRPGFGYDIGRINPHYLERFRNIVLRRSPVSSRPPASFRLAWVGDWYELWVRQGPRVLAHIPLGSEVQPGARPRCSSVARLARRADRSRNLLATVERTRLSVVFPIHTLHPPIWVPDGTDSRRLVPKGPGRLMARVSVERPDRYLVWIEGSFGRGYRVSIDGRTVGSVRYQLSGPRQYASAGSVRVAGGGHTLILLRPGDDLRPGNGGRHRLLGPIVLAPEKDASRAVRIVPPRHWRSLCSKRLDWIEIVER
jgi:hypothetical protein